VVEVHVAGEEIEMMLRDEGTDPDVVRGDWSALSSELVEQPSVVVRRLFVGLGEPPGEIDVAIVSMAILIATATRRLDPGP
jgi:hypothetical protein